MQVLIYYACIFIIYYTYLINRLLEATDSEMFKFIIAKYNNYAGSCVQLP